MVGTSMSYRGASVWHVERKEVLGEQTFGTSKGKEVLGRKRMACRKEGALGEQTFGMSKGKELWGSKRVAH